MFELLLVLMAVGVVMATRWDSSSRRQFGVGGLLSLALGVRITVLATAGYLGPLLTSNLLADETKSTVDASATAVEHPATPKLTAELDPASSKQVEAEVTDPISPATTSESIADPTKSMGKPAATAEARPPLTVVTNVVYLTPNRPAWLESAPSFEGESVTVAVRAGPHQTVRDCEPDLEKEVKLAVSDFINDHLRAPHASTLFRYSLNELRARKIVREQFSEQLETSIGLMSQVHARLVFDRAFQDELDNQWAQIKSKSRLAQTGLGAGIVLLFLGTLFSFLKLDTATKGYYTGRLQFGAAATILALVAASVLLAKLIPWM
jgi:hypothetical protein